MKHINLASVVTVVAAVVRPQVHPDQARLLCSLEIPVDAHDVNGQAAGTQQ